MLDRRLLTAALVLALSASFASAAIIADLQPVSGVPTLLRDPTTYTIEEIVTAGGIEIGDKLFDYFSVAVNQTGTAHAPGADAITITPVQILKDGAPFGGDFGMIFRGPWSASAGEFADSTIEFRASILPQFAADYAFKDNSLWITAPSNDTADGEIVISETLFEEHPSLGGGFFMLKSVYYISLQDMKLRDDQDFDPITEMWIIKDVSVDGGSGTVGAAHLSEFYQTFSQTPEPATALVLLVGGVGLLMRRRRRRA